MNITAAQITPERERELVEKLVDLLSSRYDAAFNLYNKRTLYCKQFL